MEKNDVLWQRKRAKFTTVSKVMILA